MDFITRNKMDGRFFRQGSANGFSSSYNEVDVRTRLVDVLKYSFNPAIPWFATARLRCEALPGSRRKSPGRSFRGYGAARRGRLAGGDPRVETVEIPGPLDRGLLPLRFAPDVDSFTNGPRRTVISISKQADVSDVGRKGYIIGNDEDWTYFYSGGGGSERHGSGGSNPTCMTRPAIRLHRSGTGRRAGAHRQLEMAPGRLVQHQHGSERPHLQAWCGSRGRSRRFWNPASARCEDRGRGLPEDRGAFGRRDAGPNEILPPTLAARGKS